MTVVEEIDQWLNPTRAPAATRPAETPVNPAILIPILLDLIMKRAELGFPLLKQILDRFRNRVVEEAEADPTVMVVGAAPDELKAQVLAWLEAAKAKAGVGMKFVYSIIIRLAPMVIDQLWDKLFERGAVAVLAADFAPTVAGVAVTEDEIIAEL